MSGGFADAPHNVVSLPVSSLSGETSVPGDKSITHRALLLGAVAQGKTTVLNASDSEDCQATLAAVRALGVRALADVSEEARAVEIYGAGLRGLKQPESYLDCANSGTTMRLLSGLLAAQPFSSELRGDESLSRRPMERLLTPLRMMGANISLSVSGTAPIKFAGVGKLSGIHYQTPVSSAQLKSCLLLASLYADAATTIEEPEPSRDHTEKMLLSFSCNLEVSGRRVRVFPSQPLATVVETPGDFSSAAFLLTAASLIKGSDVLLRGVGISPARVGALSLLRLMGADIEARSRRFFGPEPVADLRARGALLRGLNIPSELVVSAIDEFPILFVAAACAAGETRVRGVEELRYKESDRIAIMARNLRACGVKVRETKDGMEVRGGGIAGGVADARGDHRVAMAFLVAGAASREGVVVRGCESIATSFPSFIATANKLGFNLRDSR